MYDVLVLARCPGGCVMVVILYCEQMHDRRAPDEGRLFAVADEQLGHFTARQARACGYTSPMLVYHVERRRFARLGRGVYRFVRYPHSPREEVVVAWLAVGTDATASHATALDLHGLSDVVPDSVHLVLPRSLRYRRAPAGVTLHTTAASLGPEDRVRHPQTGVPVTSPLRTILDVAAAGAPFEEVARAVADAVAAGMLTAAELRSASEQRAGAVQQAIDRALAAVGAPPASPGWAP